MGGHNLFLPPIPPLCQTLCNLRLLRTCWAYTVQHCLHTLPGDPAQAPLGAAPREPSTRHTQPSLDWWPQQGSCTPYSVGSM